MTRARFSCCVPIECLQAADFFWVLGEKLSIIVTVAPAIIITLIIIIPFTRVSHVSAYAVAGMTLGNPINLSASACPCLYNRTNNSVHLVMLS